ncbi:unnamed protein product [Amoebophrya sp. A120]|nr:unnamed protein product [Amoebophrya sp. A120]|eukprot:GSA120T00011332001.1
MRPLLSRSPVVVVFTLLSCWFRSVSCLAPTSATTLVLFLPLFSRLSVPAAHAKRTRLRFLLNKVKTRRTRTKAPRSCCCCSKEKKQAALERAEDVMHNFESDAQVVANLIHNAKGYLSGLTHWADLWEHGDMDPDMLFTNDRVAQTKIREINFTLTSAKRSLQWLTTKYALNNAKYDWKASKFGEEDWSLIHEELMPRVKEKQLIETEARKKAEAQYAEVPVPSWETRAAFESKYTPNLKGELLTQARFQSLELTQLFSDFDEAQRTWEIAKLASAWQDKPVTAGEEATKELEENDRSLRNIVCGAGKNKFLGSAGLCGDGHNGKEQDILGIEFIDTRQNASDEVVFPRRESTNHTSTAALDGGAVPVAGPLMSAVGPEMIGRSLRSGISSHNRQDRFPTISEQDEIMVDKVFQSTKLRQTSDFNADFRKDALETKQVLQLQAAAIHAAKDEMRQMILQCNAEQTKSLVKLLLQQHAQQMEALRKSKLEADQARAKESQLFERLQESLRAIDVKLAQIDGKVALVAESVDAVSGKVDQVQIKLEEMDAKLLNMSNQLEKLSWLQRMHNRCGTAMFVAILVLGVLVLL